MVFEAYEAFDDFFEMLWLDPAFELLEEFACHFDVLRRQGERARRAAAGETCGAARLLGGSAMAPQEGNARPGRPWLRPIVDYGPLAAFFLV
ncbi:MAG: hypothetical protein D6815_05490, partial [Candidatus Dadabacteria bacterium]